MKLTDHSLRLMPSYKETVLPIMRAVRDLILPSWGKVAIIARKSTVAADIVTQLDIDVEIFVSKKLKALYPDIAFVGEEHGGNREAKRFWLMDPIDGTAHFVRGLPFCTSMLALIEDDQVVFSVIYDFINEKMYWAERGKGAFCNDEPITVNNLPLEQSYLCWETHLDKEANQVVFLKLFSKTVPFKGVCAGWEMAMIACGKLEGRVSFNPHGHDYDYAPGSLLIAEAGGIVTNIGSSAYDYRNTEFIAANPVVHKQLTGVEGALFPITATATH